jgi:hypothetical protein
MTMAKKTHAHDDDDEPVKKAPAYDDEPVAKEAEAPAPRETTDAEDIASLTAAIVALIQQAEFDDLTWPEVDRALRLTSHEIRQNWSATGTVKPAPPPEPDPPEDEVLTRMEGESDEDFASRKRAVRARHASGLESLSPAPRSRYAG